MALSFLWPMLLVLSFTGFSAVVAIVQSSEKWAAGILSEQCEREGNGETTNQTKTNEEKKIACENVERVRGRSCFH